MKFYSIIILVIFSSCATPANLSVNKTTKFNSTNTITVISRDKYDPVDISGKLENMLLNRGFSVVSEEVALEKAKTNSVIHDGKFSSESYSAIELKSVYALKYKYTYAHVKQEMGIKNKDIILEMSGNIVDLADGGKLVATFTYSHGLQSYNKTKGVNDLLEALLVKLLN